MFGIRVAPDLQQRLDLLGRDARFDLLGPCPTRAPEGKQEGPVFRASCGGGKVIPLLRVLLTNRCTGGCRYCMWRGGRDLTRVTLSPDEMSTAFDGHLRAHLVRGIFLSSGIDPDPIAAMDRLLDTAALIRRRRRFRGYLHLKILPGAEDAQVEEAVALASRVSVNLEAPNRERLQALAPGKTRPGLLREQIDRMGALAAGRRMPQAGWTTQYVVGPAGETDRELLDTTQALYRRRGLRRAYFSAFEPVHGTPLAGEPSTPTVRQHRLYQADHLMRFYGFDAGELAFDDGGRLPVGEDPKRAWARAHPERFPIEIERASRDELLRVPGLGPVTVRRILAARREGHLDDAHKLRALGVVPRQCAGYLTLAGRALRRDVSARQGELFVQTG
jgi:predicted DNA-binding helix-hairpin-helix protein